LNHHASADFWACYRALPDAVRDLSDKSFSLLKADPRHPSLHFRKWGASGLRESGSIIARSLSNPKTVSSGSGSARMPTMTESSAEYALEGADWHRRPTERCKASSANSFTIARIEVPK